MTPGSKVPSALSQGTRIANSLNLNPPAVLGRHQRKVGACLHDWLHQLPHSMGATAFSCNGTWQSRLCRIAGVPPTRDLQRSG